MTLQELGYKLKEDGNRLVYGGSLYLENTSITALPDNLSVGGSLDLENTSITALPDNLSVGGSLDLIGTSITNYPYVQNCGSEGRTIYLDWNDKNIICIGCFRGNEEEAIQAISKKYQYNYEERDKYIKNVKECFAMWKKINS